jgi:hypothetical protein
MLRPRPTAARLPRAPIECLACGAKVIQPKAPPPPMSLDKLDISAKRCPKAGLFPRSQVDSLSTAHTEDQSHFEGTPSESATMNHSRQTVGLFPVEDGPQDYMDWRSRQLFDIDCPRARQISQEEPGLVSPMTYQELLQDADKRARLLLFRADHQRHARALKDKPWRGQFSRAQTYKN